MCDKGHRYFKFDDASVVCRRCGEQKVVHVHALIAQMPHITYLPCPHPHYPAFQPFNPWQPTWISNGTAPMPTDGITIINNGSGA